MAKRIGETFVERGLITESQLEMALKAQLIYGGHLGTCLIELGLVGEDVLGTTLAKICRVPYAPASLLQEIPEGTIKVLSAKVAEEYQAIPLKVSNKVLHVAMVEPRNLRAIDELSFASGYRVEPWVSPELRIFQALEKYYGIGRHLRYIALCRALEAASAPNVAAGETAPPAPSRPAEPGGPGSAAGQSESSEQAGSQPPPPETAALETEASYGYGKSWQEIADEIEGSTSPAAHRGAKSEPRLAGAERRERREDGSEPRAETSTRHASGTDKTGSSHVAERLCRADSSQEAIAAFLDHLAQHTERSLFFGVTGNAATLLDGRGDGIAAALRSRPRFPAASGSLFELLHGEALFRGPIASPERHASFYKVLGFDPPAEIILAPVHLSDRLVGLFYGDVSGKEKHLADTEEYRSAIRLLALALSLVVLKQKIRSEARSAENGPGAQAKPSREEARVAATDSVPAGDDAAEAPASGEKSRGPARSG